MGGVSRNLRPKTWKPKTRKPKILVQFKTFFFFKIKETMIIILQLPTDRFPRMK